MNNIGTGLIYSTYWGGTGDGGSIWSFLNYLDNHYTIYMGGYTDAYNFPVSASAYQKTLNGVVNAVVVKIYIACNIIYTGKVTGSPYCPGDTIHVPFTIFYPMWTGNVFFVQLSDSSRGFAHPINIGSMADTSPSTITAVIPKSALYGRHYRLRVIATAPYLCSDNTSNYFTINPSPNTGFNDSTLLQCSDNKNYKFFNSFIITHGKIIYFNWNFGDNTLGTSIKDTIHTYNSFGKYKAMLIAKSNSGCADTVIKVISLRKNVHANIYVNDTIKCLKNNMFFFQDSSLNFGDTLNYKWFFGDGFLSSIQNPAHFYDSVNNYLVKLIVKNQFGCADWAQKNIFVNLMPVADFKIIDSTQCLKANKLVFANNSSIVKNTPLTFKWYFGNGDSSALKNPVYSYKNSGNI